MKPLSGLHSSYPDPTQSSFSEADWAWFMSLPADYRAFLQHHNGGFVESLRYAFLTGVPYRSGQESSSSRSDCVLAFFGIPGAGGEEGEGPEDVIQLAVDHAEEDFLPSNLLAIAACTGGSLICLAVEGPDCGSVYYWDAHWHAPCSAPFFEARAAEVEAAHPEAAAIAEDPDHPQYRSVMDAFNAATVVKLADSLAQWLQACRDQRLGVQG